MKNCNYDFSDFRNAGIDVEITAVVQFEGNKPHKIGYRSLVSHWDENNILIKTYYLHDRSTYEEAASDAMEIISKIYTK